MRSNSSRFDPALQRGERDPERLRGAGEIAAIPDQRPLNVTHLDLQQREVGWGVVVKRRSGRGFGTQRARGEQLRRPQRIAVEHDRALEDVPQLAHVAGPRVSGEPLDLTWGELRTVPASNAVQQVL